MKDAGDGIGCAAMILAVFLGIALLTVAEGFRDYLRPAPPAASSK